MSFILFKIKGFSYNLYKNPEPRDQRIQVAIALTREYKLQSPCSATCILCERPKYSEWLVLGQNQLLDIRLAAVVHVRGLLVFVQSIALLNRII